MRGQSEALGLNGRIATTGFSRGSGVALMAVTTEQVEQWRIYINNTTYIPIADTDLNRGTYPDESASVQGAVIMSGRFTYVDLLPDDPNLGRYQSTWGPMEQNYELWEYQGAIDFLTEDPGYPLFLTINNDDKHAHHQMDVLQERLSGLGVEYLFFEDTEEPLAHRMPLVHSILNGMNRYLRSVLMEPSPDAAVAGMRFNLENTETGVVRYTAEGPVPPVDYRLYSTSDLVEWVESGTVRPKPDGVLQLEIPVDEAVRQFYRLGSPLDPV